VIAGREHSLSGLPTVMQSRAAFFNAPFLLVTLLSVGCTIHVNEVQPKLDRILKDGNEFQYTLVHGNGVHLVKLPGATISLNASETLGNGDYGPENYRKTAHFDVDGHEGPLLHFTFFTDADIASFHPLLTSCSRPACAARLRQSTNGTFHVGALICTLFGRARSLPNKPTPCGSDAA
jgi:hypothetical protein